MKKRSKHGRSIACEPLEGRRMFVTYQVTGTSGADAISISIDEANNRIISAVNGVSGSASDLVNNAIQIDGLGGNDTISITETGDNTVVVNAGIGSDTINLGNGGNSLAAIQGAVTINGEDQSDTLVLFDQSNGNGNNIAMVGGNTYLRSGFPSITANVANVTIHASTVTQQVFSVDDPPLPNVLINGSTQNNFLQLHGNTSEIGTYSPSGATKGAGSVTHAGAAITFNQFEQIAFDGFGTAKLVTPNASDALTLSGTGTTIIAGTSGSVQMALMSVTSASTLELDLATNDAGGGNDSISGPSGHQGVTKLAINAGTGTNQLTATGGTWNITTALGAGGAKLDVIVDTATLAFAAGTAQSLHRLQVDNGGVISIGSNAGIVTTAQLAVVAGSGTLNVTSPSSVTVSSGGSFSLGSGRTLNKGGSGVLTVNAPQSHGTAGALFNQQGTTNLNTDGGTPTFRGLNIKAQAGTINLGATQHVAAVIAVAGNVVMLPNGNRLLVANSISSSTDVGVLNLNDNDLIVHGSQTSAVIIRAFVREGYADGAWNGTGINSAVAAANGQGNTTLGLLTGNEYIDSSGSTTFDGEAVLPNDVLVKYTYYGDVDFNGTVDVSDYNLIDFGFVNHLTTWGWGDADNNGSIDVGDYNVIDFAFATQTAVL